MPGMPMLPIPATHATHATHGVTPGCSCSSGFGLVGHHHLRGDQQRGDRHCILKAQSDHLGGIEDAGLKQVLVGAGEGVEALAVRCTCSTTTSPLEPALMAICLSGALRRAS